jgi:hypothetical protein
MEQKHKKSPVREKFKSEPTTGNEMLTLFWDSHGPVLKY